MDDYSAAPNNPYQAPQATSAYAPDDATSGEFVLAGRGTRFGAAIIDNMIQIIFVFLILAPFFYSTGIDGFIEWSESDEVLSSVVAVILSLGIYFGVNFYLLQKNGQTIGKYLCHIKIVRTNGSRADVQRILLYRELPILLLMQVPFVGNYIALIDAVMIFRDSRKCLHDDIADTIVIKA
ncbi:MAG: RDD family protein [Betaproteobacteria bacterium]|nr:RDD family protein [Betaproteobacteria bacterium]